MKLSCVILTKDEEKNIEKCLQSVKFCDEVIVIDDFSEDSTVKIAKKCGARIFKSKLNNSFSEQRNFGLSKVKSLWALFVDADEVISPNLKKEILQAIKNNQNSGYLLRRRDFFLGKEIKYGESGEIKLLRLFKKHGSQWNRGVHEYALINGKVGFLKSPILHYPHPKLKEFIKDINFYTQIHSQENLSEGKNSSIIKIMLWPLAKFFNSYVLQKGYKDGYQGLIFAFYMSFHSYISWVKLWEKQKY